MTISLAVGPPALRIDDERAVEAPVDVSFKRQRVAVVEVGAERLGDEVVDEASRPAGPRPRRAHRPSPRRWNPWKWIVCGWADRVDERDPQAVALGGPDRRPRHPAVVGPRREEDARGDLDLLVDDRELVLADRPARRVLRDLAAVEVGEDLVRVEAVAPRGRLRPRRPSRRARRASCR